MEVTNSQAIAPTFKLLDNQIPAQLHFSGHWLLDQACPSIGLLQASLLKLGPSKLQLTLNEDFQWDSLFMSRLYQCQQFCQAQGIKLDVSQLPASALQLLKVSTAVAPVESREVEGANIFNVARLKLAMNEFIDFTRFIGDVTIALGRLIKGQANTRWEDFFYFVQQGGPNAIGIISLVSLLVGMILAYLGLIQLRLFGAEVYVANLVTIGMVREMGALMTAVVMAGRTGAAYAAQLGTMQVNEEIDAITTLGISPIEFLVLPRMLALVCVMPLLCLFSDVIGLIGGAIVATGMDITFNQYLSQSQDAISGNDIFAGLFKSLVFAVLIALAGCKAGIQSGRNSAAVGKATTTAVVTAIVYLIIADAGLNIIYDKVGI
jgi:phospholipid/cholesterol/gamma-HCH transport system permease protein